MVYVIIMYNTQGTTPRETCFRDGFLSIFKNTLESGQGTTSVYISLLL